MLRWRLASAAVIVGVLVALVVLDFRLVGTRSPGVWLLPVLLTVCGMGAWEVVSLLRHGGYPLRPALTTALTVLVTLSFCGWIVAELFQGPLPARLGNQTYEAPLLGVIGAAMVLLTVEIARFSGDGKGILHAGLALFVVVYIGGLFGFLALLRGFHSNAWGLTALVSTLTITKFADTGAYFTGRTLGRHKMTPLLSPGKTIEGAVGGVLTACLVAWLFFNVLAPALIGTPALDAWRCLAYGAVLAVAGMFGDLAESMLKREMRSKDSSTWLPGLGGVMDIIDSVLFAAPAAYLCFVLGLVGP